ncbi:Uncharacterised protein [Mycobacteroides abscessus subsp. abscessus]|uniref:hypothetical protein n=1 Tax=Mycobacteroides abscessus TaxID=36809 RepID=UPI000928B478|nr:hypothetical protein [Mycobacteroides abscessus]SIH20138.1 Uncharacterised protein [Mycobacteroides abscessus subsp. abscessus]
MRIDGEFLLPLATSTLRYADKQEALVSTLDAYISRVEEQSYGDKTPEVGQVITEMHGLRNEFAQGIRDTRSLGKKLGKLARQPALGEVLYLLDKLLGEEAPGTAMHDQLSKARQAVEDGLADKPIPRPTDDA